MSTKLSRVGSKIISALKGRTFQAITLVALTLAGALVICASVFTVKITDGDKTITLKTIRTRTNSILELADIDRASNDLVTVEKLGKLISLTLNRSFNVTVTMNGQTKTVAVNSGATVNDAVIEAGFSVDDDDIFSISRDTVLDKETSINITDVKLVTEKSYKPVAFGSKTVYDKNSTKTLVKQKGVEGKAEVLTVKRYENGVYTGNTSVTETVIVQPIDKVVAVGTKKVTVTSTSAGSNSTTKVGKPYDPSKVMSVLTPKIDILLDDKGIPVNYTRRVTVQATAYSGKPSDKCSTGVNVKVGYIAVNPKVIPYGTKMYIVSSDGKYVYGYCVAADTGGFIRRRPTNVDLFMSTEELCKKFGRRNVDIYFFN